MPTQVFPQPANRQTKIDIAAAVRHSAAMSKSALGRGLGALLGGTPVISKPTVVPPIAPATPITPATPLTASSTNVPVTPTATLAVASGEQVRRVPVERIRPSALQPRKDFPPEALRELADSIREQGIVQPLIVRAQGASFELIAGERRWRAAQLAGQKEVPVIVREANDREVLEMALIENLQRENLNPLEEALGYSQLTSQFDLTQEQVAAKVGKSRAVVANVIRLLKLPLPVQNFLRDGRLSVGHAKVILGLNELKQQEEAAERIIKEALNVRQAEGLVAKLQHRGKRGDKPTNITPLPGDAHVADLENRIRERLGTKVQLRYAHGKGSLEVSFFSDDELERVLQILGVSAE